MRLPITSVKKGAVTLDFNLLTRKHRQPPPDDDDSEEGLRFKFTEIDFERLTVGCPVCGVDFNHAKTASIEVGEDGRGEITGVKIGCVCESGDHAWTLRITQDKGQLFLTYSYPIPTRRVPTSRLTFDTVRARLFPELAVASPLGKERAKRWPGSGSPATRSLKARRRRTWLRAAPSTRPHPAQYRLPPRSNGTESPHHPSSPRRRCAARRLSNEPPYRPDPGLWHYRISRRTVNVGGTVELLCVIDLRVLTPAKQKMEESAGLVFKDVPMLAEGKIIDSWG